MTLYGPLQIVPPGLLGFFQLKSAGKNPRDLSDVVQPTLDMLKWDLLANVESINSDVTLTNGQVGGRAFTTPASIVVPETEWWYVHDYCILASNLVATDTCAFACKFTELTSATPQQRVVGLPSPLITGTAATRQNLARSNDFWVPPGALIAIQVLANETAGSIAYSGYVRFTRLPI